MRVRMIAGAVALAALILAVGASAKPPGSDAASTVALQWNANAVAAVRAATTTNQLPPNATSRALYQTEGELYMSYVQAAVYDAATKIGHRFVPYHHFSVGAGNASIEAAVIAAAYNTLVAYHLNNTTTDSQYAASIAALPDDKNTARGIAVGEAAAADIVALRANDGRNAATPTPNVGTPTNPVQAGVWVWPPAPSLQIDQTPWLAVMQPFMLDSTSQFRAPPPNALTSTQYAADLNETKAGGSTLALNDPKRDTAWFWNANAISQSNMTLRDFATQNGMDLLDTVRLLAMGNMVSTDAGMACFDSKYTYRFWRPITAIRNADIDGNSATTADGTWSPLAATPNHPEYPSQHGCVTSALAEVLAHAIGTDEIDVTIHGANAANPTAVLPDVFRTFPTVQSLNEEIVKARIWIGFHFRSSVVVGENLGTSVANWELQRNFLPTNGQDG
jgi:PAP2 superfamily